MRTAPFIDEALKPHVGVVRELAGSKVEMLFQLQDNLDPSRMVYCHFSDIDLGLTSLAYWEQFRVAWGNVLRMWLNDYD